MQSKHKFLEEEPIVMLVRVVKYENSLFFFTLMPSMEPMLITEEVFSKVALAFKRGRQLLKQVNTLIILLLFGAYAWVKVKIRFKFKLTTFSKASSG